MYGCKYTMPYRNATVHVLHYVEGGEVSVAHCYFKVHALFLKRRKRRRKKFPEICSSNYLICSGKFAGQI